MTALAWGRRDTPGDTMNNAHLAYLARTFGADAALAYLSWALSGRKL